MIGSNRPSSEWIRGAITGGLASRRSRRIVGVALLVVLLGLSGVLASANGVSVEFTLGGADDEEGPPAAEAATEVPADRPEGFVGDSADDRSDADGDGITDRAEREIYGTDPAARDTDGDGIPDGMELACNEAYPDADPLQQDVYVELDSVDGVALSNASVEQLEAAFADAPVANPGNDSGNDSGIDVHLVRSDDALPENGSVNDDPRPGAYNDVEDYREDHFQHESAGYYYLLVAETVAYNGDDYYAGAGRPGTAIVEHYDRDAVMASLVLHELGHAFGIDRGKEGVDAHDYSREEYQSVMNYNALYEMTNYSDGDDAVGRDEWSYVADDRHRPAIERDDGDFCPNVG